MLKDEADHILALDYENWLLNEFVGINEENGHYMTSVTIAALPADGSPCYLVCGPYRVNVVEPGVYRFPLNVFETYDVAFLVSPGCHAARKMIQYANF